MAQLVIGFGKRFYTLWEISKDYISNPNSSTTIITHYKYVKNISFDLEKVKKLFPEVDINDELCGKTKSWSTKKIIWDNVDRFRFGKYNGQKIMEVKDLDYTGWYWKHIENGDHREFVKDFLYENWYEFRIDANGEVQIWTPKEVDAELDAMVATEKFIARTLRHYDTIYITPTRNVNAEGIYKVADANIIYKFAGVKEGYYQGFYYYLPVQNGKAKRIKNKDVKITEYSWDEVNGDIVINIEKFEIIK